MCIGIKRKSFSLMLKENTGSIFFQRRLAFFTLIFFGCIYALISWVNHYLFRTSAYDLGIYNQAIYHYAHLRINHPTIFDPPITNFLSDHFDLVLPVISPLYYLFGSYTLLIVQVVVILIGGLGVFRYFKLKSTDDHL